MDSITLFVLALGLSMDAFAVSISNSMCFSGLRRSEAALTSLSFGVFQGLMPVAGYFAGRAFAGVVSAFDHWIAFVLLVFLGGRMIIEGLRGNSDDDEEPLHRHGFWLLVTTAIATSLDAMAVGVGLAFLQVNIIATALAIGCATLIMSTLGIMVGRFIGPLLGKRAEILGGIVLIGIGAQILWAHFAG